MSIQGRIVSQYIRVAATNDIAEGKAIAVEHGNRRIAVFRINGAFFACADYCPHAGGYLSEGFLEGTHITCPWHGWTFDLNPATAQNDGCIRYRVHVEGEDINVELPD